MKQQPESPTTRRVTVAVHSASRNLEVFELAAALAAPDQAELEALIVEDAQLFRLAALPFAYELERSSGAPSPLETARIQALMRSRLAAIEQAVAQAAARHRLRNSLRVCHGHYWTEALSGGAGADVLIVVRERSTRPTTPPLRRRPRQDLYVLFDGSAAAERTLTVGLQLAQQLGLRPVILLEHSTIATATLQRQAQAVIGRVASAPSCLFYPLSNAQPKTLAAAPGIQRATLLAPLQWLDAQAPTARTMLPAQFLLLVA